MGKYYGLAFSDLSIYMQKNHVACCENGHRHEKRLAKSTAKKIIKLPALMASFIKIQKCYSFG